ncbi:MAG: hypothetical protein EA421_08925 [Gemmatimonadales bacterium]|nr:MAG: hypothetical protein EA421_08925 [Gemmatimonadales bacterium]
MSELGPHAVHHPLHDLDQLRVHPLHVPEGRRQAHGSAGRRRRRIVDGLPRGGGLAWGGGGRIVLDAGHGRRHHGHADRESMVPSPGSRSALLESTPGSGPDSGMRTVALRAGLCFSGTRTLLCGRRVRWGIERLAREGISQQLEEGRQEAGVSRRTHAGPSASSGDDPRLNRLQVGREDPRSGGWKNEGHRSSSRIRAR